MKKLLDLLRAGWILEFWLDGTTWCCLASRAAADSIADNLTAAAGHGRTLNKALAEAVRRWEEQFEHDVG